MKITFDPKTEKKIEKLKNIDLVFDFDHTLSRENISVDGCSDGISRYRIVIVKKGSVPSQFDSHIDSKFGPIYYKGYGHYFFQKEMYTVYNPSYNLIELHSTAELLSKNILIVDFRDEMNIN